jgi:uncharacterized protein YggT (Ycf19 family)
MDPTDSAALVRAYWYYYLAYYFVYWFVALLLTRFIFSLFVRPDSLNVIWRVLLVVTDPLLRAAAPLTPAALGGFARPLVAAFWLILLLAAYWLLLYQMGWAPARPPASP